MWPPHRQLAAQQQTYQTCSHLQPRDTWQLPLLPVRFVRAPSGPPRQSALTMSKRQWELVLVDLRTPARGSSKDGGLPRQSGWQRQYRQQRRHCAPGWPGVRSQHWGWLQRWMRRMHSLSAGGAESAAEDESHRALHTAAHRRRGQPITGGEIPLAASGSECCLPCTACSMGSRFCPPRSRCTRGGLTLGTMACSQTQ